MTTLIEMTETSSEPDDDLCDDGEEDGDDDDCGLSFDDGQCSMAGSEHCDWSCRWSRSKFFAGNPGFKPKRKRKDRRHG